MVGEAKLKAQGHLFWSRLSSLYLWTKKHLASFFVSCRLNCLMYIHTHYLAVHSLYSFLGACSDPFSYIPGSQMNVTKVRFIRVGIQLV